jgi:metal-responsive CopG/Arc/MetJ family transcriptional regulator
MQTHTIEVIISTDLLERIDERAQACGRDRSQVIQDIIARALQEEKRPHAGMTFAEILEPLQKDFEATGMTEEELGEFIDAEIKAYRSEQRAKKQSSNG